RFDQYQWQDRTIHVQEDRSHESNHAPENNAAPEFRAPSEGYGPGPGHVASYFRPLPMMNQNIAGRQVFVGNLPFQCQWQDLKDLFRKAGPVLRADVALGFDGRSRGFGSVLFVNPEDAKKAIETFDNYEFQGRNLRVHYDRYSHLGHGVPVGNNMGPMMHPHPPPPHPHGHPHHLSHQALHPHPHPHHRMHPIHAQHNHGFPGTFHPQQHMIPLGNHSIGPQGQFGAGPPLFNGRPFSPTLLGPGSNIGGNFNHSNKGPPPSNVPEGSNLASPVNNNIATPPGFEPTSGSLGMTSPSISSSTSIVAGSDAAVAPMILGGGPAPLSIPMLHSAPQPYPFLMNLGAIRKPPGGHDSLNEPSGANLLSGVAGGENDFTVLGNPYHFVQEAPSAESGDAASTSETVNVNNITTNGSSKHLADSHGGSGINGSGPDNGGIIDVRPMFGQDDGIGSFSPGFYMYPPLLPRHHQQLAAGYPPFQDSYSREHAPLPHVMHGPTPPPHTPGVTGNVGGGNGLGRGLPNQPEWIAHPSAFTMGPFQPMYGALPSVHHGHGNSYLNDDDDEQSGKYVIPPLDTHS
ncbi:hypothetical protein BGW38_005690, partial [Lunasporangiospora selenospora]